MKSTISASLLAFGSFALAQQVPRFSLVTASANNDLHLKPVNASGQQLWINKATSSYCPAEQVGAGCPAGNITSFAGGNDTLGMNVMVPGGQQVYVNGTGSIKFTQAHSAGMDAGSTTTGWEYIPAIMEGYGQLIYNGQHGFLACPLGSDGGRDIKAIMNNVIPTGCDVVNLLVPDAGKTDAPAAWQYT